MKRLLLTAGLVLPLMLAVAQKKKVQNDPNHDDRPLHFGFSIGLNSMDFRIRHTAKADTMGVMADVARLQPGFQVHAISNFRLGNYFDIRILPGISFGGEREITYRNMNPVAQSPFREEDNPVRIESNFVEMPILLKYKSTRVNNFRPYLLAGSTPRYDLAATKKTWGRTGKSSSLVILDVFDFYYDMGFGIDFYLEYFKFTLEMKYSVGIRNIIRTQVKDMSIADLPPEDAVFTNVIDKLNSRMFIISFNFE